MKNNRLGWIGFFGLGALLIYILDPQMGRRRRALVRDKMRRFGHKTRDAIDVTSRYLKNRVLGVAAETRNLIPERGVSDDVLEQRVRSKLGALVSHPASINVKAENGRITVSGPVLSREVEGLLKRIWSIPGVKHVENRLEVTRVRIPFLGCRENGDSAKAAKRLIPCKPTGHLPPALLPAHLAPPPLKLPNA